MTHLKLDVIKDISTHSKLYRQLQQAGSQIINYTPDATVVTDALYTKSDFFASLDKQHILPAQNQIAYLSNQKTCAVTMQIITPGGLLAWLRKNLT